MLQGDGDPPQGPETNPTGSEPRFRSLEAFSGSLSHRTYQSLHEAILTLACRPGEPLKKGEICAALGVSRSPVAEAISRLSAEGLVDVVPQAGTFVARFSMDEIREGAFLREAIELAAIDRVAPVITEDQLVHLRRNLRVQEALLNDSDIAGFYRMDAEFHETLLSFTGFRRVAQVAETAWVHVNRARQLILPVPGRVTATLAEHKTILAGLEDRDAAAARSALQHHLRQLMTLLAPLERDRPDLFLPP